MQIKGSNLVADCREALVASPVKTGFLSVLLVVFVVVLVAQLGSAPPDAGAGSGNAGGAKNSIGVTAELPSGVTQFEDGALERLRELRPAPQLRTRLVRDPFAADWLRGSRIAVSVPVGRSAKIDTERDEVFVHEWRLTATFVSKDGRGKIAVISGVTYRVGDSIGTCAVEEIGARFAIVRCGGERIELRMQ
ncbi:MAG: hypothetical protein IIB61_01865 [Planctomycetes bacterium]|nr:hypothetical protein [Planctomycetota bacterium]